MGSLQRYTGILVPTIEVAMPTDCAEFITRSTGKSLRNVFSRDISVFQVKILSSSYFYKWCFTGKTSWIYWKPNIEHFYPGGWIPIELKTTRSGTTPEGSEWAKVNLPMKGSSHDSWAFKDLVEVPETLDPGHYVLSFRWDCQQSPQVWNACANIKIV